MDECECTLCVCLCARARFSGEHISCALCVQLHMICLPSSSIALRPISFAPSTSRFPSSAPPPPSPPPGPPSSSSSSSGVLRHLEPRRSPVTHSHRRRAPLCDPWALLPYGSDPSYERTRSLQKGEERLGAARKGVDTCACACVGACTCACGGRVCVCAR